MELMRRKVCGEVRKAWTCEITWFLDQVAGLDERLHYIVINDLILFDDEDPATYYIIDCKFRNETVEYLKSKK